MHHGQSLHDLKCRGNPAMLRQAFMNLIANAINDLNVPTVSGVEVLRAIKADDRRRRHLF
jgi:signal transduction histidine kinase